MNTQNVDHAKPYSGLRVLDLSQGVAGPYCGTILAEQGADVIKVEPPQGDWSRGLGKQINGVTPLSFTYNVGKRSIVIDAQQHHGRDLIVELARTADIVIESFRPGVMHRLGLSYETLSKQRPGLIYVSITAFGQDGPYADRPGSDSTLQALSGMMAVNRDDEGMPRKIGLLVADIGTGIYAAQAVGAALYAKLAHGVGAHIDLSLLQASAAFQGGAIVDSAFSNWQSVTPYSIPAGTFETADGYINVTSLHNKMFIGLCEAIGKDDWISDPRFANPTNRFNEKETIYSELRRILQQHVTSHWVNTLTLHGVVCGKVSNYREFLNDPQVVNQEIFRTNAIPGLEQIPLARLPGLGKNNDFVRIPRRGEHTRQILVELGISEEKKAMLFDAKVVASWEGKE